MLRKRVGIRKTGLVGFVSLIAVLSMSIVSIWLPGSPFDPYYLSQHHNLDETLGQNQTHSFLLRTNLTVADSSSGSSSINGTDWLLNSGVESTAEEDDKCQSAEIYTSVIVFLTSIILGRFGLWISDLSVTQIMQVSSRQLNITGQHPSYPILTLVRNECQRGFAVKSTGSKMDSIPGWTPSSLHWSSAFRTFKLSATSSLPLLALAH